MLARILELALSHPEGPAHARLFDRTFQFQVSDDAPFFLELQEGAYRIGEGDCGLDWQRRDWQRATCIFSSTAVLQDILAGRRLITEAYFAGDLGFAPQRAADPHTSASALMGWFYGLLRLGFDRAAALGFHQALDARPLPEAR